MLRWVQQHNFHKLNFLFQLLYREFRPDPVTTVRKKKQWQQKHSQSLVTTEMWWMAGHSSCYQQKYKSTVTESNLIIQRLPVLPSWRQEYFLSLKTFIVPTVKLVLPLNWMVYMSDKGCRWLWLVYQRMETVSVSLICPRILWTSWELETNMTSYEVHNDCIQS